MSSIDHPQPLKIALKRGKIFCEMEWRREVGGGGREDWRVIKTSATSHPFFPFHFLLKQIHELLGERNGLRQGP